MSANTYGQFDDDAAFNPQAEFEFDHSSDTNGRHPVMNATTATDLSKRNVSAMLDASVYGGYPSYQQFGDGRLHSGVTPAAVFPTTTSAANMSVDATWPTEDFQLADSVLQRYGQITPPDDNQSAVRKIAGPSETSLDKSERARHAANHRHSKKARRESRQNGEEQSGGEENGDKREEYREKNRQAAAKCRDKKKKNTEELDKKYKRVAAENAARKQEVRLLRDEFCRIRELALQHAPEHCACSSLHAFNMQQAVKEASQMSRTMGGLPLMGSPSNDEFPPDEASPHSSGNSAAAGLFPDPALGYNFASGNDFQ